MDQKPVRQDVRVVRTKAAIRTALFSIAEESGVKHATVTEIARRAHINRKTFYVYYDSVGGLVQTLMDEMLDNYRPLLAKVDLTGNHFDTARFMAEIARIVNRDMESYHILYHAGLLTSLLERAENEFIRVFMEQLGSAEREKYSRYRVFAEFISAGLLAAISRWIREKEMPLEDFSALIGSLALSSFRAMG